MLRSAVFWCLLSLSPLALATSRREICESLFKGFDTLPGADALVWDLDEELRRRYEPRTYQEGIEKPSLREQASKIMMSFRVWSSLYRRMPHVLSIQKRLTISYANLLSFLGSHVRVYRWRHVNSRKTQGYRIEFLPDPSDAKPVRDTQIANLLREQKAPLTYHQDVQMLHLAIGGYFLAKSANPILEADLDQENWHPPEAHSIVVGIGLWNRVRKPLEHELFHARQHVDQSPEAVREMKIWPRHCLHLPRKIAQEGKTGYVRRGFYTLEEIGAQLATAIAVHVAVKTRDLELLQAYTEGTLNPKTALIHAQEAFGMACTARPAYGLSRFMKMPFSIDLSDAFEDPVLSSRVRSVLTVQDDLIGVPTSLRPNDEELRAAFREVRASALVQSEIEVGAEWVRRYIEFFENNWFLLGD